MSGTKESHRERTSSIPPKFVSADRPSKFVGKSRLMQRPQTNFLLLLDSHFYLVNWRFFLPTRMGRVQQRGHPQSIPQSSIHVSFHARIPFSLLSTIFEEEKCQWSSSKRHTAVLSSVEFDLFFFFWSKFQICVIYKHFFYTLPEVNVSVRIWLVFLLFTSIHRVFASLFFFETLGSNFCRCVLVEMNFEIFRSNHFNKFDENIFVFVDLHRLFVLHDLLCISLSCDWILSISLLKYFYSSYCYDSFVPNAQKNIIISYVRGGVRARRVWRRLLPTEGNLPLFTWTLGPA